MSADNWAVCPRCKFRKDKEAAELKRTASDAYGIVDPEEYIRLLEESKKPVAYGNSLREDFHIGVDKDGMFEVSYSCICEDCGLTYGFAHDEEVPF